MVERIGGSCMICNGVREFLRLTDAEHAEAASDMDTDPKTMERPWVCSECGHAYGSTITEGSGVLPKLHVVPEKDD